MCFDVYLSSYDTIYVFIYLDYRMSLPVSYTAHERISLKTWWLTTDGSLVFLHWIVCSVIFHKVKVQQSKKRPKQFRSVGLLSNASITRVTHNFKNKPVMTGDCLSFIMACQIISPWKTFSEIAEPRNALWVNVLHSCFCDRISASEMLSVMSSHPVFVASCFSLSHLLETRTFEYTYKK